MAKIPDDVMKAARNVAISLLYPEVDDDGRGYLTQEHIDLIARAILAERERCAKIAERMMYGATAADIIRNA